MPELTPDNLYSNLLAACQEVGRTTEHTEELLSLVLDSITVEPAVPEETIHQLATELRDLGCAVVVWNATELRGADPSQVQDAMLIAGTEAIETLVGPDPDDTED